ncbi:hypothetical protein MXMO3_00402 [Maritalea myrionectae]|uniref:Dienelactone hydrolase domain-containing protein n=1 Tax=Maritalea myrionectae TaxID=454601 RepID=A0A2R4MAQ2_9HYPH|nr:dienelactone hydrolase family protein [Maritalea myrionectae]AVX02949.1 hypothetical protein MXMO3_00402 [Maritalea myrionectae]
MTHIVLFHSILGLRPIEKQIAAQFEAAGHTVILPDLFGGQTAENYENAFAMRREINNDTIMKRATSAVDAAPATAILSGVSFGAALVGEFWSSRPQMPGALLFAGITEWMTPRRSEVKISAHIAKPDPFDDEDYFENWVNAADGPQIELYRYENAGHYFLDPSLPDYDAEAASLCMQRAKAFLAQF